MKLFKLTTYELHLMCKWIRGHLHMRNELEKKKNHTIQRGVVFRQIYLLGLHQNGCHKLLCVVILFPSSANSWQALFSNTCDTLRGLSFLYTNVSQVNSARWNNKILLDHRQPQYLKCWKTYYNHNMHCTYTTEVSLGSQFVPLSHDGISFCLMTFQ